MELLNADHGLREGAEGVFNLVLAVGVNGLLAMFSERDFAETLSNTALRAKHSRHD